MDCGADGVDLGGRWAGRGVGRGCERGADDEGQLVSVVAPGGLHGVFFVEGQGFGGSGGAEGLGVLEMGSGRF